MESARLSIKEQSKSIPTARSIDIDLMICLFPAFEGYAAIDDGTGDRSVQARTSRWNTHPWTAARGEAPHPVTIGR